jgi:hypothetical protein
MACNEKERERETEDGEGYGGRGRDIYSEVREGGRERE